MLAILSRKTAVPTLLGRIGSSELGPFRKVQLTEAQPTDPVPPVSAPNEVPDDVVAQSQTLVANGEERSPTETSTGTSTVPAKRSSWDTPQREVIEAAPEDRLMFNPGPARGTAAVLCARVARLVDEESILPNYIWVIASHPTTVLGIRDQIALHLKNAEGAQAVNIARLAQDAWTIHSGSDEEARVLGSHSNNIEGMRNFVRRDGAVSEYLEYVDHLLVSEAGRLSGNCAEIVIEMVRKLRSDCGVTVFTDEARSTQARTGGERPRSATTWVSPLSHRIRHGELGVFRILESPGMKRAGADPGGADASDQRGARILGELSRRARARRRSRDRRGARARRVSRRHRDRVLVSLLARAR